MCVLIRPFLLYWLYHNAKYWWGDYAEKANPWIGAGSVDEHDASCGHA
jgi:hypothetical protein